MLIKTTRFGPVEVSEDNLFSFSEGLLGFQDLRKFVLLDDPNDDIFAWLQSCEEPSVAFPVLEPELFTENYSVQISKSDLQSLQLEDQSQAKLLSIITIPDDPTMMTANLKAPLVFNLAGKKVRQCVLADNGLAIREPIFLKLQQRVVAYPQQSIKEQSTTKNVSVKITPEASL